MKKQEKIYYTTDEAIAFIKKESKKQNPIVNAHLKKYLQKIVDKEIAKDCRAEAMRILLKANREEVAEFLFAFHSDGTEGAGIYCIALDFIKDRLVKDKEVGKNFGSKFGNKFEK